MVQAKDLMRTDFVSVDLNDTVSVLLGKLIKQKQTFAVVFEGKKYRGLVEKGWLLTSKIDSDSMKLSNITKHASKRKTPFFVPQLEEETELADICKLLVTSDVRALPVIAKEKVVGVVTAKDVVKELQPNFKGIPVLELAKTKLVTLKENDELGKMIKLFSTTGVERAPVVNAAGKLVGIASINDFMTKYQIFPSCSQGQRMSAGAKRGNMASSGFEHGEKQNLMKLPVANIIVKDPMVCVEDRNCTVAEVITQMTEHDVTSIIITEKDKPIGIITVKDILMEFARK